MSKITRSFISLKRRDTTVEIHETGLVQIHDGCTFFERRVSSKKQLRKLLKLCFFSLTPKMEEKLKELKLVKQTE